MAIAVVIACVLLNTFIGIVFKFFERYGISNKQAIAVNYWVCVITGIIYSGVNPLASQYITAPFFKWGLFNGFFYFVIFIFIALSTVKNGIATTQVANRLSMVLPVGLMVIMYGDSIGVAKILGIILAMASVVFTSYSNQDNGSKSYLFPLIIFFGSGLLDFVASSVQRNYLNTPDKDNAFLITCFATAAICSSLYLIYLIATKQEKFSYKSIIAGIVLGFPNYFSILFFIKALGSGILKPTAFVPVNNISVVLVSAVVAILLFNEQLSKHKLIGILLAVLSIICIVIGDA